MKNRKDIVKLNNWAIRYKLETDAIIILFTEIDSSVFEKLNHESQKILLDIYIFQVAKNFFLNDLINTLSDMMVYDYYNEQFENDVFSIAIESIPYITTGIEREHEILNSEPEKFSEMLYMYVEEYMQSKEAFDSYSKIFSSLIDCKVHF